MLTLVRAVPLGQKIALAVLMAVAVSMVVLIVLCFATRGAAWTTAPLPFLVGVEFLALGGNAFFIFRADLRTWPNRRR
ncbi:heme exporter protein D [Friedmanniella endophytica]|uniref:Heme exporter protein D n=1 Tax=Microlunatus kandeliicorticis TaxID=1759536 RepID=A0A7W3P460_9ACTN|nr:hypothetical protein [Microlunatus kandeliicorticis]MBA8792541.1 heme exporter protein D [Microlunatus kandeliicorticis]